MLYNDSVMKGERKITTVKHHFTNPYLKIIFRTKNRVTRPFKKMTIPYLQMILGRSPPMQRAWSKKFRGHCPRTPVFSGAVPRDRPSDLLRITHNVRWKFMNWIKIIQDHWT